MRRYWLASWFFGIALFAIAGCHSEVPEDVPLYDRLIGLPDKFFDVKAFDTDRAMVIGYAGRILLTEDSGMTWSLIHSGTDRALYAMDFVNDRQGWITGQDGIILHTSDGGKTWERQTSGTVLYLFAVDFLNEREGWIAADKATYLHTTDGGKTWRLHKMPKASGQSAEQALVEQDPILYDVQFVDRQTGWMVGEFGKLYHTTDGGGTWVEKQGSLMGEEVMDVLDLPTFFGVHFVDASNGIAVGLEGRIARTADGGANWHFDRIDADVPLADPLFRPLQFPDQTGWAVGAAGEVVRQYTKGRPWQRASLGMEVVSWLRGLDFVDKDNGWIVGGYGLILHTTDGGKTWLPCVG